MKEKIGSLLQFLAVIIGFVLIFWGIGGAYQAYFNREEIETVNAVYNTTKHLIGAVIGAGVGIFGVIIGNVLKKI